jgi:hypothetical protein
MMIEVCNSSIPYYSKKEERLKEDECKTIACK